MRCETTAAGPRAWFAGEEQAETCLGLGLGMTVYGEGAESSEEVAVLRDFGCDVVQGYAFAHPTVASDALAFARDRELAEAPASGLHSAAA